MHDRETVVAANSQVAARNSPTDIDIEQWSRPHNALRLPTERAANGTEKY